MKGDIKNLLRTDYEEDLLYDEEYDGIYDIFCGHETVSTENSNTEKLGIDFNRIKDMNRLFNAKMSDAGKYIFI